MTTRSKSRRRAKPDTTRPTAAMVMDKNNEAAREKVCFLQVGSTN